MADEFATLKIALTAEIEKALNVEKKNVTRKLYRPKSLEDINQEILNWANSVIYQPQHFTAENWRKCLLAMEEILALAADGETALAKIKEVVEEFAEPV